MADLTMNDPLENEDLENTSSPDLTDDMATTPDPLSQESQVSQVSPLTSRVKDLKDCPEGEQFSSADEIKTLQLSSNGLVSYQNVKTVLIDNEYKANSFVGKTCTVTETTVEEEGMVGEFEVKEYDNTLIKLDSPKLNILELTWNNTAAKWEKGTDNRTFIVSYRYKSEDNDFDSDDDSTNNYDSDEYDTDSENDDENLIVPKNMTDPDMNISSNSFGIQDNAFDENNPNENQDGALEEGGDEVDEPTDDGIQGEGALDEGGDEEGEITDDGIQGEEGLDEVGDEEVNLTDDGIQGEGALDEGEDEDGLQTDDEDLDEGGDEEGELTDDEIQGEEGLDEGGDEEDKLTDNNKDNAQAISNPLSPDINASVDAAAELFSPTPGSQSLPTQINAETSNTDPLNTTIGGGYNKTRRNIHRYTKKKYHHFRK